MMILYYIFSLLVPLGIYFLLLKVNFTLPNKLIKTLTIVSYLILGIIVILIILLSMYNLTLTNNYLNNAILILFYSLPLTIITAGLKHINKIDKIIFSSLFVFQVFSYLIFFTILDSDNTLAFKCNSKTYFENDILLIKQRKLGFLSMQYAPDVYVKGFLFKKNISTRKQCDFLVEKVIVTVSINIYNVKFISASESDSNCELIINLDKYQ